MPKGRSTSFSLMVALLAAAVAPAAPQDPVAPPAASNALLARVQAGGDLVPLQYRRGADGRLEAAPPADPEDGTAESDFRPVIADRNLDLDGPLSALGLCLFGNGDILSLTDFAWHGGRLGIDASDVGLRQLLAVDPPMGAPQLQRAGMLDQALAIDELVRRGCTGAVAELQMLAADSDAPPLLRERSARGLARLRGATAPARARLDPETVPMSVAFDAAVVVDQTRLPDVRPLLVTLRRVGLELSASRFGGMSELPPAVWLLDLQRTADALGEGPFDVALRYGNARFDHTLVTLRVVADEAMPVAVQAVAVGAFEAESLRTAFDGTLAELRHTVPGLHGELAADRVALATDDGRLRPRPDAAAELLQDTGSAVRVVVPANSKLLPMLVTLGLPPATGVELRIAFGDDCRIEVRVTARDEDAADAWVERGERTLELAQGRFPPPLLRELQQRPALKQLVENLLGAQCRAEGRVAIGAIRLPALAADDLRALMVQLDRL